MYHYGYQHWRQTDDSLHWSLGMSWIVYMLRCADNSLYTGVTTDVDRRLNEHNSDNKKGAKYTRVRRPVSLAYQEYCLNRADACRREHEIKQLSRTQKLNLIRQPSPS